MARSDWSTSNYLRSAAAPPVVAAPLSMAVWGNATTASPAASLLMMELKNSTTAVNTNVFMLFVSTSGKVSFEIAGPSTSITVGATGVAIVANSWFHAGGVISADGTSMSAYNNGVRRSVTNTQTPSGLNSTVIGVDYSTGPSISRPFLGQLAEAALWNIALSDSDFAMLAAGISPLLVHPEALVAYWPLIGNNSPENNLKSNSATMSITGSLSKSAHPRIYMPKRKLIGV